MHTVVYDMADMINLCQSKKVSLGEFFWLSTLWPLFFTGGFFFLDMGYADAQMDGTNFSNGALIARATPHFQLLRFSEGF